MKKVILCAAALMIGGFAFAQVTTTNETAPSVTGPQASLIGAPAEENVGKAVQNGTLNIVQVHQAGEMNSAYSNQDDGGGSGGNQANILQIGDVIPGQAVNPGNSGEANLAEVYQTGTENLSTTWQEGDRNNALTKQGQNNTASDGNKSWIRQGVAMNAEDNFAAVEQDGIDNEAHIRQTTDNNDAWTRQNGEENKSRIRQWGSPENSAGHMAMNYQDGLRNKTNVDQFGSGARNTAFSVQSGDDNIVMQNQEATSLTGTGNLAVVNQGYESSPVAVIDWPGDVGVASTTWGALQGLDGSLGLSGFPTSHGNEAYQDQKGMGNEAVGTQYGDNTPATSDYLEQKQVGDDNKAYANQMNGAAGSGDNYASQLQVGDDNVSGLAQNGTLNKAYQNQQGDMNSALSTQIGTSNALNIHQFGDANAATSVQHGSYNQALVVQRDGQSFAVEQGMVNASSYGNQANIYQTGPNGPYDLIDCTFDPNIMASPGFANLTGGFPLDQPCPDCVIPPLP